MPPPIDFSSIANSMRDLAALRLQHQQELERMSQANKYGASREQAADERQLAGQKEILGAQQKYDTEREMRNRPEQRMLDIAKKSGYNGDENLAKVSQFLTGLHQDTIDLALTRRLSFKEKRDLTNAAVEALAAAQGTEINRAILQKIQETQGTKAESVQFVNQLFQQLRDHAAQSAVIPMDAGHSGTLAAQQLSTLLTKSATPAPATTAPTGSGLLPTATDQDQKNAALYGYGMVGAKPETNPTPILHKSQYIDPSDPVAKQAVAQQNQTPKTNTDFDKAMGLLEKVGGPYSETIRKVLKFGYDGQPIQDVPQNSAIVGAQAFAASALESLQKMSAGVVNIKDEKTGAETPANLDAESLAAVTKHLSKFLQQTAPVISPFQVEAAVMKDLSQDMYRGLAEFHNGKNQDALESMMKMRMIRTYTNLAGQIKLAQAHGLDASENVRELSNMLEDMRGRYPDGVGKYITQAKDIIDKQDPNWITQASGPFMSAIRELGDTAGPDDDTPMLKLQSRMQEMQDAAKFVTMRSAQKVTGQGGSALEELDQLPYVDKLAREAAEIPNSTPERFKAQADEAQKKLESENKSLLGSAADVDMAAETGRIAKGEFSGLSKDDLPPIKGSDIETPWGVLLQKNARVIDAASPQEGTRNLIEEMGPAGAWINPRKWNEQWRADFDKQFGAEEQQIQMAHSMAQQQGSMIRASQPAPVEAAKSSKPKPQAQAQPQQQPDQAFASVQPMGQQGQFNTIGV